MLSSLWLRGSLLILSISSFIAGFLWYTVNSDRTYLHPLLIQIIPAGHCSCTSASVFECSTCPTCSHQSLALSSSTPEVWEFKYPRDAQNTGLTRGQCTAALPGLFEDVTRAATYWCMQGGLSADELDAILLKPGMGRARIARGHLYVVALNARSQDHRRKILAVLSAMHRALVSDPDRSSPSRPEIEFVFSVEDKLSDVSDPDANHPIWTLARTPCRDPKQSNVLRMEEHCGYMFIAHVEGRSYSASLKYRQACRSVIVSHQLQYIQHHHYLLVASGPVQNYVEVARDFSDLDAQVETLLTDPDWACRIAENNVRTFRERYLTAAAEACYWRVFWDGYGAVYNSLGVEKKGVRYELFILQDDFTGLN